MANSEWLTVYILTNSVIFCIVCVCVCVSVGMQDISSSTRLNMNLCESQTIIEIKERDTKLQNGITKNNDNENKSNDSTKLSYKFDYKF